MSMTPGAEWRNFSRPALSFDDSTELFQRAAAIQIIDNIDKQIQIQQTIWTARDQDWAAMVKRPYAPITVMSVKPRNVYTGHGLDFQVAPLDTFPAITVRCFDTAPADDREQPDQFDQIENSLVIEICAIAGPFENPISNPAATDAIDRQLHRLTSAVRGCIDMDRSLGFATLGIRRPPRGIASLPFVTNEPKTGTGSKYLLQAVQLTYNISALTD